MVRSAAADREHLFIFFCRGGSTYHGFHPRLFKVGSAVADQSLVVD